MALRQRVMHVRLPIYSRCEKDGFPFIIFQEIIIESMQSHFSQCQFIIFSRCVSFQNDQRHYSTCRIATQSFIVQHLECASLSTQISFDDGDDASSCRGSKIKKKETELVCPPVRRPPTRFESETETEHPTPSLCFNGHWTSCATVNILDRHSVSLAGSQELSRDCFPKNV